MLGAQRLNQLPGRILLRASRYQLHANTSFSASKSSASKPSRRMEQLGTRYGYGDFHTIFGLFFNTLPNPTVRTLSATSNLSWWLVRAIVRSSTRLLCLTSRSIEPSPSQQRLRRLATRHFTLRYVFKIVENLTEHVFEDLEKA